MSQDLETIDHTTVGLSRRPDKFKEQENLEKMFRIFLDRLTAIDTVLVDWCADRNLADATGFELDVYGEFLERPRPLGQSDEVYRAFLLTEILVNQSSGTLPELIQIALRIVPENLHDEVSIELGPNRVRFNLPASLNADLLQLAQDQLCRAVAAGDLCEFALVPSPYFGWAEDPDAANFNVGFWSSII